MLGLMTKREHDAIVAAKDAEIARLHAEAVEHRAATSQLFAKLRLADNRYDRLEARLAVLTAPRQRDERGRFVGGRA